ncbi:MAG: antA/AntB antirepressor family protein [Acidithiobacillus sp.]
MNTNTDLIPLSEGTIQGRAQTLCDARDLHTFLGVGAPFAHWISRRIRQHGFVEGQDFKLDLPILTNQVGHGGDRKTKEYHLTVEAAKHIAMAEHTPKGKEARDYFIERERLSYEAYAKEAPGSDHGLRMEQPISLLIPPQAVITCIMPDMRVHTVFWPDKTSRHKVVLGSTSALQDYISGLQSPMPLPILFATPLWFDLMGRRAIAITDDTSRAGGNVPHALFPAAQCLIIGSEEETIKLCNDKGYSIDSYLVPHNETERRVKP